MIQKSFENHRQEKLALGVLGGILSFAVLGWNIFIERGIEKKPQTQLVETDPSPKSFDYKIFSELLKIHQESNFVVSSFGLKQVLGMIASGSVGETRRQILSTLFPYDEHQFQGQQSDSETIFENRAWFDLNTPIARDFERASFDRFRTSLGYVEFSSDSKAANEKVNRWIFEKTNGQGQNLQDLQSLYVPLNANQVLVTSLFLFRPEWNGKFSRGRENGSSFQIHPKMKTQATFIRSEGDFKYFENQDLQIIEIPFAKGQASLVLFLPRKLDGIAELENKFDIGHVMTWLTKLKKQKTVLRMPAFKIKKVIHLENILVQMGIRDAFDRVRADFSNMPLSKETHLGQVVQEVGVEVSETGTQDMDRQSVWSGLNFSREQHRIFNANHPFVFMIRKNATNTVLALGHELNPSLD